MSILTVSDTNPNDVTGGGGCVVCGSTKNPDQRGPFVIVTNDNEMESNVSPHVVLCATCIDLLNQTPAQEPVSAGEKSGIVEDAAGRLYEGPVEDEEVPSV
jgi:hypothetical protein